MIGNSYIYGQNFPMARSPYTEVFIYIEENPSFQQEEKKKRILFFVIA